jgi:hypothetical protein
LAPKSNAQEEQEEANEKFKKVIEKLLGCRPDIEIGGEEDLEMH